MMLKLLLNFLPLKELVVLTSKFLENEAKWIESEKLKYFKDGEILVVKSVDCWSKIYYL